MSFFVCQLAYKQEIHESPIMNIQIIHNEEKPISDSYKKNLHDLNSGDGKEKIYLCTQKDSPLVDIKMQENGIAGYSQLDQNLLLNNRNGARQQLYLNVTDRSSAAKRASSNEKPKNFQRNNELNDKQNVKKQNEGEEEIMPITGISLKYIPTDTMSSSSSSTTSTNEGELKEDNNNNNNNNNSNSSNNSNNNNNAYERVLPNVTFDDGKELVLERGNGCPIAQLNVFRSPDVRPRHGHSEYLNLVTSKHVNSLSRMYGQWLGKDRSSKNKSMKTDGKETTNIFFLLLKIYQIMRVVVKFSKVVVKL